MTPASEIVRYLRSSRTRRIVAKALGGPDATEPSEVYLSMATAVLSKMADAEIAAPWYGEAAAPGAALDVADMVRAIDTEIKRLWKIAYQYDQYGEGTIGLLVDMTNAIGGLDSLRQRLGATPDPLAEPPR